MEPSSPLSLFDVSGRSALVIGATGSFGSAGARALAGMGCDLTLADLDAGKLDDLAGDLRGDGVRVETVAEIATSEESAGRIIDAAVSARLTAASEILRFVRRGAIGSSNAILRRISRRSRPAKAGRSVSNSYSVTPNE